jgi:hypothetical protein
MGHEQTNRPRQSRVCFSSLNRPQGAAKLLSEKRGLSDFTPPTQVEYQLNIAVMASAIRLEYCWRAESGARSPFRAPELRPALT